MVEVVGVDPERRHFIANARMCNFIEFYAFCTFRDHLIWPMWGSDLCRQAAPYSGRLSNSKSPQVERLLFFEMIRKSLKGAEIPASLAAIRDQREGRPDWR